MIEVRDISFGYEGNGVLSDVSLVFPSGRFTALLGPNGAGKSTLLRICGGELTPDRGAALFDGRELRRWKPRELAARRAFLPQDSQLDFPFTVEEVVMLGRTPHIVGAEKPEDVRIVREALALSGMEAFANRDYTSLSGGERQRVQLARVLAQAWRREGCALLMDEPVANLDPSHQHGTLSLARKWAKAGACVVAILHDVNLALRYADVAVVLDGGRVVANGSVRDVLTAELVTRVFNVDAKLHEGDAGEPPFIVTGKRGRTEQCC
jgi:iron complex transport system ATP-binding protein